MTDDTTEKSIEESTQKEIDAALLARNINPDTGYEMMPPKEEAIAKMKKDWTESEQADNMANFESGLWAQYEILQDGL